MLICFFLATTPLVSQESQNTTKIGVRVVDGTGQPVEGVSAFWFHEGKAKKLTASGSNLEEVTDQGLVVATKEGFQYSGLVLGKGARELKLLRLGKTGPRRKTLPSPIAPAVRKQIVSEIVKMIWTNLETNPKNQRVLAIELPLLAKIAPDKAQEFIDSNKIPAMMLPMVQKGIVEGLAKSDFDAAAEIVDTVNQPEFRSMMLQTLLQSVPVGSPQAEAIEEQLMATVKSVKQPGYKMAAMASLAERYRNNGQPEKAKKIVDLNLPEVEKLPSGGWSAYPRSLFAAMIVSEQPDKAMQLIEGTDIAHEKTRALGRLAFHCCRSNPDRAIEFLSQMKHDKNAINKFGKHYRVAHRMSPKHPKAAMKLAETVSEDNQRAWTFGQIAAQLQESDSAMAKLAFQKAIESLDRSDNQAEPKPGEAASYFSTAETLAGLLPIAEEVTPDQMNSLIWKCVWKAIPRSRWVKSKGFSNPIQNTAAAIARYDREIGLALCGNKIIVTGRGTEAVITQLVFLPREYATLFSRENLANRQFSVSRGHEKAIKLLNANERDFWQLVSEPEFMQWPSEKYEDH